MNEILKESVKCYGDLKKSKMAVSLRSPSWILVNLNISCNSPCWSAAGHQILKESVKRFKSYRDLKKSKMVAGLRPPSWILVNLSISSNSPCGSEVGHQISKESVERFKTTMRRVLSSIRVPTAEHGSAVKKSPAWGAEATMKRALSLCECAAENKIKYNTYHTFDRSLG
jgi:hypothetical protein